jgi:pyridoxal phosphate enzyme (YggS family)
VTTGPAPAGPALVGRAEELAARLAAVERRLVAACEAAGRRRSSVRLVAVTKFHPARDVEVLRDLGVRAFGESRDQEARDKAGRVTGVQWHFIGRLQTNKAASVATYATVVESCDRMPLVTALSAGARKAARPLEVLVQVSLDGDPDRGGAPLDQVAALADAVAAADGLRLRGLMAVAPQGADPAEAFARLAAVAEQVRSEHPEAMVMSAGMTGDLEQAIAAGSTSVRVGTALLGPRPPALR